MQPFFTEKVGIVERFFCSTLKSTSNELNFCDSMGKLFPHGSVLTNLLKRLWSYQKVLNFKIHLLHFFGIKRELVSFNGLKENILLYILKKK